MECNFHDEEGGVMKHPMLMLSLQSIMPTQETIIFCMFEIMKSLENVEVTPEGKRQ